ncbi:hypothetical protein BH20ACT24_BH20ACT24_20270 [soil metagenome]
MDRRRRPGADVHQELRAHRLVGVLEVPGTVPNERVPSPSAHRADREIHEDRGDPVPHGGPSLVLRSNRHGHHGSQLAAPRRLSPPTQEPVERPGDRCQDDVIDAASEPVLHVLEGLDRGRGYGEPAVRPDAPVERAGRGQNSALRELAEPREDRPRLLGHTRRRLKRALDQIRHPAQRMDERLSERVKEQLPGSRDGASAPGWRRKELRLGGEVEDRGGEVDGRHSVDHRVVDLRQERRVTVVHPLDEIELPHGLGAVQRT